MNNGIFPIYQSVKDTVKVTGLSEFYIRKLLVELLEKGDQLNEE